MYQHITVPTGGQKISVNADYSLTVPDQPIIPYIEGDGTGMDITPVMIKVVDAAVKKSYGGTRQIHWMEIYAGEKATKVYGPDVWLPEETLQVLKDYVVSIKGPLTTPVGGGIRSLNVALRQMLDLYVCLRPVQYFTGVPSPVKHPEKVEMVIFRENTEDIYAGIEYAGGTPEAQKLLDFIAKEFPKDFAKIRFGTKEAMAGYMKLAAPDHDMSHIPVQVGLGIKPVSNMGTIRLMKSAIEYAIREKRKSVTIVHKGNIMKFTEGAFRDWAYQAAERIFGDKVYTWAKWERTKKERGEASANEEQKAALKGGAVLVKDAIADITLQQVLTRPEDFDVIATLNLNGDYLSDALAAQVGGIGIAPGGNINYVTGHAIFEATHGTAPKYANLDKVNPGSVVLSGEMMFRYLGWTEVADLIIKGLNGAIGSKKVTYDFARQMEGASEIKCSEFGDNIIAHM